MRSSVQKNSTKVWKKCKLVLIRSQDNQNTNSSYSYQSQEEDDQELLRNSRPDLILDNVANEEPEIEREIKEDKLEKSAQKQKGKNIDAKTARTTTPKTQKEKKLIEYGKLVLRGRMC